MLRYNSPTIPTWTRCFGGTSLVLLLVLFVLLGLLGDLKNRIPFPTPSLPAELSEAEEDIEDDAAERLSLGLLSRLASVDGSEGEFTEVSPPVVGVPQNHLEVWLSRGPPA